MSTQAYLAQIKEPIHLPHAALSFACAISYPDLDVTHYLGKIDRLAEETGSRIPSGLSDQARGVVLSRLLFNAGGFHGNTSHYYDPRNSFLNEVLDRRLGIPISLSVVFIEVGRQLGLNIQGVALPGHFITCLQSDEGPFYFDPFHSGRALTTSACETLVRRMSGKQISFNPDWLAPVGEREILARMLLNLRAIYLQNQEWRCMLQALELLQITRPEDHSYTRDIGMVYNHIGEYSQAIYYLEAYLMRNFQANDSAAVRTKLNELVRNRALSN